MDLSGLESADAIDTLEQRRFRIVWDHLGWFPPQVVPVLFPPNESTDSAICDDDLTYTCCHKSYLRANGSYSGVGSDKE
jgi:hypothetical protein